MNTLVRFASTFVALTALVVPGVALAKGPPAQAAQQGKAERSFPMKADAFKERVAQILAKHRAKIEAKMDKRGVPGPKREEIRKAIDAAQGKVNQAVSQAAKDGVITRDEAKNVRELTRLARKALRENLGLGPKKGDKHEKHEKKGKGHAKAHAA